MAIGEPSDREAIQAAIVGVMHRLDRKQWAELRELFADTVRTDYTSLFGGEVQEPPSDALIENWRKLLTPMVTQHLLGPIAVEASGDDAVARCHVRAYHHKPGVPGGDEWMLAGHYIFGLTRRAGGWCIRAMTLEALYQTGNLRFLELAHSSSPAG